MLSGGITATSVLVSWLVVWVAAYTRQLTSVTLAPSVPDRRAWRPALL